MAVETGLREGAGDFAAYVTRNLDRTYRFTVVALGDVVRSQDITHDALMATWQVGSAWPAHSVDAALGRRLVGLLRSALHDLARPGRGGAEGIGAALRLLDPDEQLVLAERLGLPGTIEPVAATLRGRGALDRRVPAILARLGRLETIVERQARERSTTDGAAAAAAGSATATATATATTEVREAEAGSVARSNEVVTALSALYVSRDPAEAPAQLRWRLERSLREAQQAAFEQAEIADSAGWGFAVKTVLVVLILTLAIGVASVAQLQRQGASPTDQAGGPAFPLTIAGVSTVNGSIEGASVHVAATRSSLVASFQASAAWHLGARECRPDVLGVVDGTGQAQWLGQIGGHVDSLAGDPASDQVFMTGPGPYCDATAYLSGDGGRTWASLPGSAPWAADWLGFDPTNPQHLLVASEATLSVTSDGGATWHQRPAPGRPIGFDADGRLVAWRDGVFLDSHDEGASWLELGPGPAQAPPHAAAQAHGILAALPDGLWWYPFGGQPHLVANGNVLALATYGESAVVVGTDAAGHPWLATVSDGHLTSATLPPEIAARTVTGAEVAANGHGAVIALSGTTSAIVFASFVD